MQICVAVLSIAQFVVENQDTPAPVSTPLMIPTGVKNELVTGSV